MVLCFLTQPLKQLRQGSGREEETEEHKAASCFSSRAGKPSATPRPRPPLLPRPATPCPQLFRDEPVRILPVFALALTSEWPSLASTPSPAAAQLSGPLSVGLFIVSVPHQAGAPWGQASYLSCSPLHPQLQAQCWARGEHSNTGRRDE